LGSISEKNRNLKTLTLKLRGPRAFQFLNDIFVINNAI